MAERRIVTLAQASRRARTPGGIDPAEYGRWPDDLRAAYQACIARGEELLGIPPKPYPWGADTETLLRRYFPRFATSALAPHHHEFWDLVRGIEPERRVDPIALIVGRGGAKTTTAELATVLLGALRRRRYALFVRATQNAANRAVMDLAAMMQSPALVRDFPDMGRLRTVGRRFDLFTVQQIRTKSIVVDGIGLDTAARGLKFEEDRPDFILFDDIDRLFDTPAAVRKKIETITSDLIPAGAPHVVVVIIENLVHGNSVSAHVTWPDRFPADEQLLLGRRLIGPVPAVRNLEVAQRPADHDPQQRIWVITGGQPTWEGFGLDAAQASINASNLPTFLREAQHDLTPPAGTVFSHVDVAGCDWDDVPWGDLVDVQVWVDPATSNAVRSDCQGIVAAGCEAKTRDARNQTVPGRVWVLRAYEQRTSPTDALERAIGWCWELGGSTVGIETDNGGEAWKSVASEALRALREAGSVPQDWSPRWAYAKAGSTGQSKDERIKQLVSPLERRRVVLVDGTTVPLAGALARYNSEADSKPWDSIDAFWHALDQLDNRAARQATARTAARRRRPEYRPTGYRPAGARSAR